MAPHGKLYYSTIALFAFLAAVLFSFATIRAKISSLFGAAVATIFLLGALQALERLVRSQRAIQRSQALSASTRRRLRIICEAIRVPAYAAYVIGFTVRLAGTGYLKGAATDTWLLGAFFFFAGACLADLAGEKLVPATHPIGT
jgi:hypothetical protein